MLSGEFERKLRKLNSNLRVWCGDDSRRPAGLYHVIRGQFTEICGVDKNWVPKYDISEPNGRIIKAGWYRTLRILVAKGLVDKRRAERVFGTYLEFTPSRRIKPRTVDLDTPVQNLGMHIAERLNA